MCFNDELDRTHLITVDNWHLSLKWHAWFIHWTGFNNLIEMHKPDSIQMRSYRLLIYSKRHIQMHHIKVAHPKSQLHINNGSKCSRFQSAANTTTSTVCALQSTSMANCKLNVALLESNHDARRRSVNRLPRAVVVAVVLFGQQQQQQRDEKKTTHDEERQNRRKKNQIPLTHSHLLRKH